MVVAIFSIRMRPDAPTDEYGRDAARMNELVRTMPGFVSEKSYTSEDGEEITLVTFEDEASLDRWREHPEHRAVQQRAKERYYASYWVHVLKTVRRYEFPPR